MKPQSEFWKLVSIKGENECWEWQGSIWHRGYGKVAGWRKLTRYAHRLAYIFSRGSIPEGMHICHSCDNPRCVNPAHLWCGTNNDNRQDSVRKRRHYHGERVSLARRGELHPLARVTEKEVLEIRAKSNAGSTYAELRKEYNLTPNMLSKIIHRRTWNHI